MVNHIEMMIIMVTIIKMVVIIKLILLITMKIIWMKISMTMMMI